MKKINLFALMTILFGVTLFAGCRGNDDDVTDGDGDDKYGQTIEVGNFEGKYRMINPDWNGNVNSIMLLEEEWHTIKVVDDVVFFDSRYQMKEDIQFYSWGCIIPEPTLRGSCIAQIQYPK